MKRVDKEAFLRDRGWFKVKGFWRHFEIHYGWPLVDAYQLAKEAERGDSTARRILGMPLAA